MDIKQWGVVASNTQIKLPISATILRYVASVWDAADNSDIKSSMGTEYGSVQVVGINGFVKVGSSFYIAICR